MWESEGEGVVLFGDDGVGEVRYWPTAKEARIYIKARFPGLAVSKMKRVQLWAIWKRMQNG